MLVSMFSRAWDPDDTEMGIERSAAYPPQQPPFWPNADHGRNGPRLCENADVCYDRRG